MIGKRIEAFLADQRRSVQELAAYCGVSVQTVYNWLNEKDDPKAKRKPAIAAFFGITVMELEYGETSAVMSLVPLPGNRRVRQGKLSLEQAHDAADLLLATLWNSLPPKSVEYMEGMRSRVVQLLSGKVIRSYYKVGTCQHDAFEAGFMYSQTLISTKQISI